MDFTQGSFGDGLWFSSLLLEAIRVRLTGAIVIEAQTGKALVFFRRGQPVHASGAGFNAHHLGQVLLDRSLCSPDQVQRALQEQQSGPDHERRLLGEILVQGGVDATEVERAIRAQTHARLGALLQQSESTWCVQHGSAEKIEAVAIPLDPWGTFFDLMQTNASSGELRFVSDQLLGKAVRLQDGFIPERTWSKEEGKLLEYLKKPRKLDHLERAVRNRRMVRGFIRCLSLMDVLQFLPASEGIAIPKALKHHNTMNLAPNGGASDDFNRYVVSNDINTNLRDVVRPPRASSQPPPIIAEIKKFHAEMGGKDHYQVLGVSETAEFEEIRQRFRDLARKFHPDAVPMEENQGTADLLRDVSARLNEANEHLSSDAKRKEYDEIRRDERIKGDFRKRELIKRGGLRFEMGVACLRTKGFDKARKLFEEAIESDPSNGRYLAYLAWATYTDPKKDKNALADETHEKLIEASKLSPEEPMVHLFLGRLYHEKGRYADALEHYKRALRGELPPPEKGEATRARRMLKKLLDDGKSDKPSGGGLSRFFRFLDRDDDDEDDAKKKKRK